MGTREMVNLSTAEFRGGILSGQSRISAPTADDCSHEFPHPSKVLQGSGASELKLTG